LIVRHFSVQGNKAGRGSGCTTSVVRAC